MPTSKFEFRFRLKIKACTQSSTRWHVAGPFPRATRWVAKKKRDASPQAWRASCQGSSPQTSRAAFFTGPVTGPQKRKKIRGIQYTSTNESSTSAPRNQAAIVLFQSASDDRSTLRKIARNLCVKCLSTIVIRFWSLTWWLSRRMKNDLKFPPNFEGLVLGCIDADFCKKIILGKLSPRSTQCTPLHRSSISKFQP